MPWTEVLSSLSVGVLPRTYSHSLDTTAAESFSHTVLNSPLSCLLSLQLSFCPGGRDLEKIGILHTLFVFEEKTQCRAARRTPPAANGR